MVGGTIPKLIQAIFIGLIISLLGTKKMVLFGVKPNKDLDFILQLIEEKKLQVVIDKTFALNETPEALAYLGKGLAKGKVVISM